MAEREHDFQRLSSSSPRRWKRKLIVKHHQLHWKSLLRDAVPLFVGASFSRAVTDVINAACGSGRIHLQIMVMFLYSLFVAHIVGYITNWFVPLEHPLASYYVDIANDNAAFGWSTTITLVILNWLYKKQRVAIALVAWMFLIFIVCCIIYFAGYFQRFYLKPSLLIHYRLRVFESEAFALAAAYSVTVIIASSIYHNESTDYLSNTDDLNLSLDNDSNSTLSRSSWYFFTYAFVWTVLLVIYQRYLDKSSLSSKLSSDDNSIKPHSVEKCIVDGEIILEESDCDPIENYITDYDKGNECEENIEDSNIGPITSSAETVLFSWDHNNRCRNTYRSFYYTFIGYMVSCAWTVWALLSFEVSIHKIITESYDRCSFIFSELVSFLRWTTNWSTSVCLDCFSFGCKFIDYFNWQERYKTICYSFREYFGCHSQSVRRG